MLRDLPKGYKWEEFSRQMDGGIYCAVQAGQVVYVGQTGSLFARITQQHRLNPWFRLASQHQPITFYCVPLGRTARERAEVELIERVKPLLNRSKGGTWKHKVWRKHEVTSDNFWENVDAT